LLLRTGFLLPHRAVRNVLDVLPASTQVPPATEALLQASCAMLFFLPKKRKPVVSQSQTLGIDKSQSASRAITVTEQMFVPG
jgi:hypothetical protein